jgi:O-antigen/teichoic acid export membrane protein
MTSPDEPALGPALSARDVRLAGRLRRPDHLLRGAYSLLANTALTSALGIGFWVAAARLYPRAIVGRDTVLISVMIELSTICQLNMANGIIRFLPSFDGRGGRALAGVYAVTSACAGVIGAGFVVGAPHISRELHFLSQQRALALAFIVSLMLWGIFSLQDAALIATRRATWMPLENGAFGALKIVALPILVLAGSGNGVFLAWVLPMALLLIPVNVYVFRHALGAVAEPTPPAALSPIGRARAAWFLGQDYLASIFTQATLTLVPLLAIARFGARETALFTMPFAIAVAFDTLATGACSALVVEATLSTEQLPRLARRFVTRVLVWLLPGAVVLAIAAPLVMLPFGAAYADHAAGALRLLALASLLRVPLALYSALMRVGARALPLAAAELALLAVTLGVALTLPRSWGVEGIAWAWLAANAIICVVIAPRLIALVQGRSDRSGG